MAKGDRGAAPAGQDEAERVDHGAEHDPTQLVRAERHGDEEDRDDGVDEQDDDASDQFIRWDFQERAWSRATPDGSALTLFRPERITSTDAGVDACAFALLSYSRKKELAYEQAQAHKGGA